MACRTAIVVATLTRDHALYLLEREDLEKLLDRRVHQGKRAVARSIGRGVGFDGDVDVDEVAVGEDSGGAGP